AFRRSQARKNAHVFHSDSGAQSFRHHELDLYLVQPARRWQCGEISGRDGRHFFTRHTKRKKRKEVCRCELKTADSSLRSEVTTNLRSYGRGAYTWRLQCSPQLARLRNNSSTTVPTMASG